MTSVLCSSRVRNLASFWLFGLLNNFTYVIMLSAAIDILHKQDPKDCAPLSVMQRKINCSEIGTGMILLADIGPSLLLKLAAPFFIQRISFICKIGVSVSLSFVGFMVVSYSSRVFLSLFGVACGSLSCGLGDVTFLTMAAFFENSVISTWSSGTGAAGIAGSVFYAVVTSFASPEVTLRATIFVPIVMLFTYLFMLDKPSTPAFGLWRLSSCEPACCPQRTHYAVLPEDESAFEVDESPEPNTQVVITTEQEAGTEPTDGTTSLDPSEPNVQSHLDWPTKHRLLKYVFPLLMSLALVYFFEYLINQALVLYQCGVFISRSSVRLVQFKRTWIMAVLQALNLGICLAQTIKPFMPSIWVMFAFILYEGILGGLSYVNTFYRILTETEPAYKEYVMSIAAFADGLGITAAALLSIPLHNALCRLLS